MTSGLAQSDELGQGLAVRHGEPLSSNHRLANHVPKTKFAARQGADGNVPFRAEKQAPEGL